jgi:hypothetical protein
VVEGGVFVLAAERTIKRGERKTVNTRRGKVIWFAVACCVSATFVGFFWLQRARPDIRLIFVGYTNEIIEVRSNGYTEMTKAILEVTNCGSVPVKIASLWQAHPGPQIPVELAGSYLLMPTSRLNPGKMESVVTYLPSKESDGRLKVAYIRLGWIDSLASKARNSRNTGVRNLGNKLFPIAKLHWAQSDWISNSPPFVPISRYHISAPPPEIPLEVFQGLKRQ